jgi:hypothetical protein
MRVRVPAGPQNPRFRGASPHEGLPETDPSGRSRKPRKMNHHVRRPQPPLRATERLLSVPGRNARAAVIASSVDVRVHST